MNSNRTETFKYKSLCADEEEDSGDEMSRRGAGRGITVPNAYTAALSDVGRASRHGVENRPRSLPSLPARPARRQTQYFGDAKVGGAGLVGGFGDGSRGIAQMLGTRRAAGHSSGAAGLGRGTGSVPGLDGVGRGRGFSPLMTSRRADPTATPRVNQSVPVPPRRSSTNVPGTSHQAGTAPVMPIAAHRLREFKIHGKIGEPVVDGAEQTGKDKDNLSYSNIILQITDGEIAGYEPREIVSAVVRATTDPSLRDFLVEQVMSASGLNIVHLKEVLGTHFSVQNATGLYKVMLRRCQREGETVQRFVQEMMKLRDQVFRLSQQEGGFYTADLMQDVFQKGVYNSLRSASVRQALRLTLRRGDLNDFELRQEISELMLDEADHETLVGDDRPVPKPASKSVAVKSVVSKKKPKEDPVVASVVKKLDAFKVDMSKDLEDFKKDVLTKVTAGSAPNKSHPDGHGGFVGAYQFPQQPFQFAGAPGPYGQNVVPDGGRGRGGHYTRGRGRGRGGRDGFRHPLKKPMVMCDICVAANALFCNHCLVCGNTDHMSYTCPERNNPAFQKN